MARFAIFTVTLDKAGDEEISVEYATLDGTAIAPDDFTAMTGTLTFAPGEISKSIDVPIRDYDAYAEEARFTVEFANPVNCGLLNASALAIIPAGEFAGSGEGDGENGPMIAYGLITNAYHNELGRGGYFHPYSGTSEGQSIAIEGSFLAARVLAGGTAEEQTAASWYKSTGQSLLDALGNGSDTSPMLRQPVPDDVGTITLLHWLYAARGDIPAQAINYDFVAARAGDKLVIPATVPVGSSGQAHNGAEDVFRVWMIYPSTSYLLYSSPYSPAYDSTSPGADTSIRLDDGFAGALEEPSTHWERVDGTVVVTIPAGAPSIANWHVVYAYENAGTIKQGTAQEAYPNWTAIEAGYSACAPDTFRWFNYALKLAATDDDRAGAAAKWEKLRLAGNRTAVRGQALSDLRTVFKPLPQFAPIPVKGEPSGIFCYSNHPDAKPPSASEIAAGANADWIGFNFFSRVGGQGGAVSPGDFTWTPQNMLTPGSWTGDIFYGAIQITAEQLTPNTTQNDSSNTVRVFSAAQIQIGRGINDQWRAATAWQDADRFLFVAIQVNRNLRPSAQTINYDFADTPSGKLTYVFPKDHLYVYLSSTKAYDGKTRWYADLTDLAYTTQGGTGTDAIRYYLVPRTAFVRKDSDSAVLPAGTTFENFGLSVEVAADVDMKLVAMRLVSGPSEQWVRDNLAQAVAGSAMPFFPGAMPFAINADVNKQQFVGWNGSPFHGYQLPDLWLDLEADANAVHPNLTAATLPVASASGAITYPISAATVSGITKPKHALLMEQQLMFLSAAQTKYATDGGMTGPFAHTFVLNTPARMTLGNPQPHTWVYVNDDPNTRWAGYQCRVVESLSRIVLATTGNAAFLDARNLAFSLAMNWLTAFNTLWPNLDGVLNPNAGTSGEPARLYGAPTDYPHPGTSAPQTNAEEPHAPALVLRACIWLKSSGILSTSQLATVNAIGKRVLDYLELRWRDDESDTMRYTWANRGAASREIYYGFWAFEIIATLAYMLENPDGAPEGADLDRAREFITLHQLWLEEHTVS